jgi:DNA-binding protein H-NS
VLLLCFTNWKSQMDINLREMSLDELWTLHEGVAAELSRKMLAEKAILEERLRKLAPEALISHTKRRAYPKVLQKYRNPKNPDETWSGRGRQPRWVATQLRSGKKLDQFLIRRSS